MSTSTPSWKYHRTVFLIVLWPLWLETISERTYKLSQLWNLKMLQFKCVYSRRWGFGPYFSEQVLQLLSVYGCIFTISIDKVAKVIFYWSNFSGYWHLCFQFLCALVLNTAQSLLSATVGGVQYLSKNYIYKELDAWEREKPKSLGTGAWLSSQGWSRRQIAKREWAWITKEI